MEHDIEKISRLIRQLRDGELDPQRAVSDAVKTHGLTLQQRGARPIRQPSADESPIKGPTYAKLEAALIAFPAKYGDKKPKLDADVRPWLQVELECSSREAYVFGAILAEHFGLDKRGPPRS